MTKLMQVLYTSRLVNSDAHETIEDILKTSRRNNDLNGLSGILLFRNGEFLQLLEGEKLNVYYTLKKIRDDKRHSGIVIIHDAEIKTKIFDKWSMAFKNTKEEDKGINERFSELLKTDSIKSNIELMAMLNKFYYS